MTDTDHDIKDFAGQFGIIVTSEAQAALPPALRELHKAILAAFVDPGAAPTTALIADHARRLGLDPEQSMAELDRIDVVHTVDGAVTVAYPFSGVPTPHRVQLDGGPEVWAMCAIDALGIPLMTGRDATITSTDPHGGEPIRIRRHATGWDWQPRGTIVLVAATGGCATAAQAACQHVHFCVDTGHARAYLDANPALDGRIYEQTGAVEAARIVFGPLLDR